jgi:hypothetical protein
MVLLNLTLWLIIYILSSKNATDNLLELQIY